MAERLEVHVRACLDSILSHPQSHRRITVSIRQALIRSFPYAVIYGVQDDAVVVYAVMHCAREQSTWRRRLRGRGGSGRRGPS